MSHDRASVVEGATIGDKATSRDARHDTARLPLRKFFQLLVAGADDLSIGVSPVGVVGVALRRHVRAPAGRIVAVFRRLLRLGSAGHAVVVVVRPAIPDVFLHFLDPGAIFVVLFEHDFRSPRSRAKRMGVHPLSPVRQAVLDAVCGADFGSVFPAVCVAKRVGLCVPVLSQFRTSRDFSPDLEGIFGKDMADSLLKVLNPEDSSDSDGEEGASESLVSKLKSLLDGSGKK